MTNYKEQTIERMFQSARESSGGHEVENLKGDVLIRSLLPVNITKLYEASGVEELQRENDELKKHIPALVEALKSSRSHIITLQGKVDEYSCDIQRVVISYIDEVLSALPEELRGK